MPVVEVGKKHWFVVCDSLEGESFVQRIGFLLSREGFRYKAGVSLSYKHGRKLHKAYQESVLAVKSKIFYEEKRNIIFYRDLEERTAAYEDIGEKPLNSIRLYMEQGNETLACGRLESWIRDIFSIPKLKTSSIEGVLIQIFAMVHLLIEKYTLNPEEKYHIPISFSILDVDSVDELIQRMNRLIQILCMEMKKEKESNPDKLVRVMTEYIHQNYNKEISLKDLAENVLFMNHTYLSHIFAEKTGSCYSAYLKQVRMEKAKEFLKKDTLSITDVAISSGYNDCSQFIRSFKKEVGMTPKKFRERHKT
ncbi:helix-turn-helix domain-containing protein [Novisyntrophococcus fermenticellae]|uniref:helix-turn-helix domain-containing protein n=1 Tax=Novisyntrophococcus fermenticellae TaxID=2068655 RepID=UPI001E3011F2|nr:helix-turn-helix domain-containing protein [Novisyntrophococcus fermenticellae]